MKQHLKNSAAYIALGLIVAAVCIAHPRIVRELLAIAFGKGK